jgi:hypothetical protein
MKRKRLSLFPEYVPKIWKAGDRAESRAPEKSGISRLLEISGLCNVEGQIYCCTFIEMVVGCVALDDGLLMQRYFLSYR